MRVVLSVDANWVVRCDALNLPERHLTKAVSTVGEHVPLLDLSRHPGEAVGDLIKATPDDIEAMYDRLVGRNVLAGEPEAFGRYLFDCVLGSNWELVKTAAAAGGEWFVEIALSWDQADDALSRMLWELMRASDAYLSNGFMRDGRRVNVAITRVVAGADARPRQIEARPRVLFVVGTSLNDESVRPAAEILCMLKRTREQQRRMHPRMIERASPLRLKDAVASFKPDVVHLLCHGGLNKNGPFLELQSEKGTEVESVTAQQVAVALTEAGNVPPIVLLSACQSGTTMEGPQTVAPFAAQLVKAGVPIVIGMSGKVSDLACRLFTRRFAESLVGSERLIVATADGRRAAFTEGRAPEKSIDWAYPTVFLSSGVEPDFTAVDPGAPPDDTDAKIKAYDVRSAPAFCGRNDFFQEFERLFQADGPAVLAAYTADAAPGYGRKRLLEELAVQAILEGHVPVLVTSRTWKDSQLPPRTPMALAAEIDVAVDTARRAFGVKLSSVSPAKRLLELATKKFPEALLDSFDEEMRAALIGSQHEIPDEAALLAIQQRLTELITRVREKYAARAEADAANASNKPGDAALERLAQRSRAESDAMQAARVVVLLDSVELYDAALKALLSHRSLGSTGLGTPEHPVPLVVTFSLKNTAGAVLDHMVQSQTSFPNWRFRQLRPFDSNGENVLAYARILLNPFNPLLLPDVSDRAWYMDDSVPPAIRAVHIEFYKKTLKGLPGEIETLTFFALALFATSPGQEFLKLATDDEFVANLEEEQRRYAGGGV